MDQFALLLSREDLGKRLFSSGLVLFSRTFLTLLNQSVLECEWPTVASCRGNTLSYGRCFMLECMFFTFII